MYPIEIRMCSKNGYFTPAEARSYYGRYGRDGITVHWWGDGTGEGNHDNIVNYIYNGSVQGVKSVNYVLSDAKITLMVGPDDVAWASQSGNATTISVETEPQLSDEGYKKWGWLVNELQGRYGKQLPLYPHNYWFQTACPGTISLDRIRQEQVRWANGNYNPAPTPAPTPTPTPVPAPNVSFSQITPATYVANKQPTHLYQVNKNSWGEIGVVKDFNKGDRIDIYGVVKNPILNTEWYVTKYSFDNKIANGFSKADLDLYQAPAPTPAPEVQPQVVPLAKDVTKYALEGAQLVNIKDGSLVKKYALDTPLQIAGTCDWNGKQYVLTRYAVDHNTKQGFLVGDVKDSTQPANPEPSPNPSPVPTPSPTDPEWVLKLRDIDDTEYWLTKDQDLIDITTGKPTGTKTFKKDESFVASALTVANGVEYRITEYSYSKKIFNGVPTSSLTLTEPGVPNVPPVVHDPNLVNKNVVIAFLETIVKAITDFIAKLKV